MKNTILYLNEPDENALIDRCQNNDSAAQHMLFNKYSSKVMAICVRYLKDREEAFAAMNQIFLKVFQNIKTFKRETKLQAWISRIAVNYLIDEIRRSKKYKKSFVNVDEFSLYGEPKDEDTSIESWWDKALEIPQQILLDMIAGLPNATRIVFNLYAIEGFNHRQIAEKIKISEGTSKWHLSNARKILKEDIMNFLNKGFYESQERKRKY